MSTGSQLGQEIHGPAIVNYTPCSSYDSIAMKIHSKWPHMWKGPCLALQSHTNGSCIGIMPEGCTKSTMPLGGCGGGSWKRIRSFYMGCKNLSVDTVSVFDATNYQCAPFSVWIWLLPPMPSKLWYWQVAGLRVWLSWYQTCCALSIFSCWYLANSLL